MSMIPQPDKLKELGLEIKQREVKSTQEEFDELYITAQQVVDLVGVTRAAAIARMNRNFPHVKAGGALFWRRTYQLEEFVKVWSHTANAKRELDEQLKKDIANGI